MSHYRPDRYTQVVMQTRRDYRTLVKVYDLGGGHKEIVAIDQYKGDSKPKPSGAPMPEDIRNALNAERAAKRAKGNIRRRVKAMGLDTLLTLTYKSNQTDEALCKRHLEEFVRRIRRVIPDFVYVAGYERQQRGAWHIHLAVRKVQSHFVRGGIRVKSYNVIRAIWRSVAGDGNIDLQRRKAHSRKTVAQLASYISKYLTKAYAEGTKHSQRWTASRFMMPTPQTLQLVYRSDIRRLIADLVRDHAPSGTSLTSCLFGVANNTLYFAVFEPIQEG